MAGDEIGDDLRALAVIDGDFLVEAIELSPILDKTAREKFTRATTLQEIKWGTFFPVYTNLACIGIVYSVISPLILVFNIMAFSLFWIVYRYNLLFVVNYRFDTGGLLFPRAINQLFTGIYVMEICLVGLFFLVRDAQGTVACAPHLEYWTASSSGHARGLSGSWTSGRGATSRALSRAE